MVLAGDFARSRTFMTPQNKVKNRKYAACSTMKNTTIKPIENKICRRQCQPRARDRRGSVARKERTLHSVNQSLRAQNTMRSIMHRSGIHAILAAFWSKLAKMSAAPMVDDPMSTVSSSERAVRVVF